MYFYLYFLLILANMTLTFSLNNVVFLTAFFSIMLIFSFLLFLFNYMFITLFLLMAYTSMILMLFLVNGLITMYSLSLSYISTWNNFSLLMNYTYFALFIYMYFFNYIVYFDFLMIYVSNFNLLNNKMNTLGTSMYFSSLYLMLFFMCLVMLISINMLFYFKKKLCYWQQSLV